MVLTSALSVTRQRLEVEDQRETVQEGGHSSGREWVPADCHAVVDRPPAPPESIINTEANRLAAGDSLRPSTYHQTVVWAGDWYDKDL